MHVLSLSPFLSFFFTLSFLKLARNWSCFNSKSWQILSKKYYLERRKKWESEKGVLSICNLQKIGKKVCPHIYAASSLRRYMCMPFSYILDEHVWLFNLIIFPAHFLIDYLNITEKNISFTGVHNSKNSGVKYHTRVDSVLLHTIHFAFMFWRLR